jgi:hypothetical protein
MGRTEGRAAGADQSPTARGRALFVLAEPAVVTETVGGADWQPLAKSAASAPVRSQ